MYGMQTSLGIYLPGQGHQHLGPGTSLVQHINWTQDQENMMRGFGCVAACGRSCAPDMTNRGLGCACDWGGKGLGLFDTGMDFSGWGPVEWGVVALGGYMVLSTVFTTGRAVSKVRALPGERRKKKAAALRARATELTRKKK
jgi:hypothetical protein